MGNNRRQLLPVLLTEHVDDALNVRSDLLLKLTHEVGCRWLETLDAADCACKANRMLDDFARLTVAEAEPPDDACPECTGEVVTHHDARCSRYTP